MKQHIPIVSRPFCVYCYKPLFYMQTWWWSNSRKYTLGWSCISQKFLIERVLACSSNLFLPSHANAIAPAQGTSLPELLWRLNSGHRCAPNAWGRPWLTERKKRPGSDHGAWCQCALLLQRRLLTLRPTYGIFWWPNMSSPCQQIAFSRPTTNDITVQN